MKVYLVENTTKRPLAMGIELYAKKASIKDLIVIYQSTLIDFSQTIEDIRVADVVICEGSDPSTVVGFCLATALQLRRPVIVLYKQDARPSLTLSQKTLECESLQLVSYTDWTLTQELSTSLRYAMELTSLRFNFFISPVLWNYLGWIAKHHQLPKAVYLRRLIESDLKMNRNYSLVARK